MGRIGRILAIAGYVVAIVVGGGFMGGFFWLYGSLPIREGRFEVAAGLGAPVEVFRDAKAVPHIYAQTLDDAYFALGFVHAQDRLWQMEITRRLAAGRLAEIAGRSALASDRFMRVLGLQALVERQMAEFDPETRRALDAYAAGVNAHIGSAGGPLSPEFALARVVPEPWRPTDSLLWAKLMAIRLGANWRQELLRARLAGRLTAEQIEDLWPPTDGEERADLGGAPDFAAGVDLVRLAALLPSDAGIADGASNAWAVAGPRSATGRPILANDPHLSFEAPVLWYLARIVLPDREIVGATAPGVPFVVLGHNGRVAWGMTTTQGDTQDLFVETVDPADSGRYLTPDGSAPFATRDEVIRVRGGETVMLRVRETRHGPVLDDILPETPAGAGKVLALAATFRAPGDLTPQAVHKINRADRAADVLAALRDFHAPQQNVFFADVEGNVGFVAAGRVPLRRAGRGRFPAPGASGEADWTGFIPFAELPVALNPLVGWIANANNRIADDGYPYFLGDDWDEPYRMRRIAEVVATDAGHTLDAASRLQMDIRSKMADELLPLMLATVRRDGNVPAMVWALLGGWDRAMNRERPEPLLFTAWLRELHRAIFEDELGSLFAEYVSPRPRAIRDVLVHRPAWCDDIKTPAKEDCAAALGVALERAVAALRETQGDDPGRWRWGDAHQARFRHPMFDGVPLVGRYAHLAIPADGGYDTVNRGGGRGDDAADPFAQRHGAGFRAVYDLADLGRSRFVIATGQSGNPLSSNYRDFLTTWRDGGFVELATARSELARVGRGLLRLSPAGS